MLTDRQGNAVSGATAEAVALFDQALEGFNLYRGDPIGLLDRAIDCAPGFAMAHLAKAHLLGLSTEPKATAEARAIVSEVRSVPMDERSRAHLEALDHLLQGRWTLAGLTLDRYNAYHPRDLLALQAGHLLDFYRGNARDLRDRIARVLPNWHADIRGYPIVLGMHAFGLEETGDYARAEAQGRRALSLEPLDCWAHHAVSHVMEMQGRCEDGLGWALTREPYWAGDDNFFKVHNWWHRALFHLQLGEVDAALTLYDGPIRQERSPVALDLVDASALLWRIHLLGSDVGGRWQELADAWDQHADGRTYAFNDWHAVMCYLGAGRYREVERIISEYRSAGIPRTEAARWAAETATPLIEGFAAFWRGDYESAIARLYGARQIANVFGGSHAQRDVIDWTLNEAALRGGSNHLAEALANERLALKPHSPINRGFLARARGTQNELAVPTVKVAI